MNIINRVINRVVAHMSPNFLKQCLFGLFMASLLALSLQTHAMVEPEPGQEQIVDIPQPAPANPDIALRVTRANFLAKELYKEQVNGEPLMEQSDRRNFRRILREQPYPKSPLLQTIFIALSNGEFELAHQAIQEAYGESVDFPDLSDFTLKDFAQPWAQEAIRAAVSHPDFAFLEEVSAPEIFHESRHVHEKKMRHRSVDERLRAEQEERLVEQVAAESVQTLEEETKARQERENQELEQIIAQSQREEDERRAALQRQQAELEEKLQAEQQAKLQENIKKEKRKKEKEMPLIPGKPMAKEAEKQKLFSQAYAVTQEIADLQAAQKSIIGQLRRLPVSEGPEVDALNNKLASNGEKIETLEVKLFDIRQDMQKLEYPDNVTQYRLVPQKNNDCGFRSARHAVLGYLHATGKIDDKAFADAIEVDEDAILSINDLKNLVKEDGTLMFPRPSDPNNPGKTLKDYATQELQLEKIVAVACQLPKFDTTAIDTSNITILPLILGLKNSEYQFIYAYTDAVRATIKQIRNSPDFVHAFILNADQSAVYEPRVTHWLPIIVKKENGQYSYTILDSLNKGRLELIRDLIYLLEAPGYQIE